jgi:hypothetical protein
MGPDENLEPKNEQEQDQSFALVFLSLCARSLLPETGDTLIAEEVREFPTRK